MSPPFVRPPPDDDDDPHQPFELSAEEPYRGGTARKRWISSVQHSVSDGEDGCSSSRDSMSEGLQAVRLCTRRPSAHAAAICDVCVLVVCVYCHTWYVIEGAELANICRMRLCCYSSIRMELRYCCHRLRSTNKGRVVVGRNSTTFT